MTHTQRESVFAIPPFACVRTISGVPTPNKPPSDPINMDNPVLLLLPVLCEDEGGRRTVVGGAARNDVLRDTERGVARNAEVAVTRSKSNRNCQPRPSPLRVPWTILMVVLFVDGMMGIERDEHTTNKQTNKEINQARNTHPHHPPRVALLPRDTFLFPTFVGHAFSSWNSEEQCRASLSHL